MVDATRTGWAAWSPALAEQARSRYQARRERLQREQVEHQQRLQTKALKKLADLETHTQLPDGADKEAELARKRAIIEAALAKARERLAPR